LSSGPATYRTSFGPSTSSLTFGTPPLPPSLWQSSSFHMMALEDLPREEFPSNIQVTPSSLSQCTLSSSHPHLDHCRPKGDQFLHPNNRINYFKLRVYALRRSSHCHHLRSPFVCSPHPCRCHQTQTSRHRCQHHCIQSGGPVCRNHQSQFEHN
jgi:hypothetical protein